MWRCFRRCTIMYTLVYLLVLSASSVRSQSNVGCLFISELCDDDERCFDDNAFGRCENGLDPEADQYRHVLSSGTTKLLEKELMRLFAGGYRWVNEYTQCVVQNILYANRHGISYDPGLCARLLHLSLPPVPPDILEDLESVDPEEMAFIKFKPDRNNPADNIYADEIFSPPLDSEASEEDSNDVKRSSSDSVRFRPEKYNHESDFKGNGRMDSYGELLLNQVMEAAKDTEQILREYEDRNNRFPDGDIPVITTALSSDFDSGPSITDRGSPWLEFYGKDPATDGFMLRPGTAEEEEEAPAKKRLFTEPRGRFGAVNFTADETEESDELDDDDERTLEIVPEIGEDEPPFRWNYKPRKDLMAEDVSKWAYKKNRNFDAEDMIENTEKPAKEDNDVEEDDYLEHQLYAYWPYSDGGMSTFQRNMRYDIKKPGPNYAFHDEDDGVVPKMESMEPDGGIMTQLTKQAMVHQMHSVLHRPVGGKPYSPREEIIEEERRFKEYILTPYFPTDVHPVHSPKEELAAPEKSGGKSDESDSKRTFEKLVVNQPEIIENPNDPGSMPMRDEDRIAHVAQTGEGHIGPYDSVDSTHAYITFKEKIVTFKDAENLVIKLQKQLTLPTGVFSDIKLEGNKVQFKVNQNSLGLNASDVASKAEDLAPELKAASGLTVDTAGIGDKVKYEVLSKDRDRRLFILAFALCGGVAGILVSIAAVFLVRRHARSREKLQSLAQPDTEASLDYQDLCRQRMCSKASEKTEKAHSPKRVRSLSQGEGQASSSSHSSTSSWNEEPVASNMDISTGHMILSYMEDHLKNKDRLDREWEALCAYEAELCSTAASVLPQNIKKNRYTGVLPYDHSRVVLNELSNVAGSDFINASSITDHDPRNPAYIATQGPLPHTAADFWQMIWEQGSVVIVMLSRLMENGVAMCHRYWPEEGSEVYHIYEVHLVSEHIWCDDYLVRSFYLKNLRTTETRTVTQFHFLSWPDNGVPSSTKALLEFRRKVNKSYRGRSCPIVVLCSDGIGRTGTYCLIDMVLNRMAKGAKEIDIAATLEHVRDQRGGMVKSKAQFEFVLMAIAEEVHAILKSLSQ